MQEHHLTKDELEFFIKGVAYLFNNIATSFIASHGIFDADKLFTSLSIVVKGFVHKTLEGVDKYCLMSIQQFLTLEGFETFLKFLPSFPKDLWHLPKDEPTSTNKS